MLRILTITSLLFCLCTTAWGQYYRPGFVVLNNGDTLSVSLVYQATIAMPYRCIAQAESGPEVEYEPGLIKSFGFEGNTQPQFESYQRESGPTFVRVLARGHLTYIEAGIGQYIIRESDGTEHAFAFGKRRTELRGDQAIRFRETYAWDGGLLYVDQLDNIHRLLTNILGGDTPPSPVRQVKNSTDLLFFINDYNRTKTTEASASIHHIPPPTTGPPAFLLGFQVDLGISYGVMGGQVSFGDVGDPTLNNLSSPASNPSGISLEIRNLLWSKQLYYQGRLTTWSHEISGGGVALGLESTPTTNYNYTLSGTINARAFSHVIGYDFHLLDGKLQFGPQFGLVQHRFFPILEYQVEQFNLNLQQVVNTYTATAHYYGGGSSFQPIYGLRAKALLPFRFGIEGSALYSTTNQVLTRSADNPLNIRSVPAEASNFQGLSIMATLSYRIVNHIPKM